MGRRVFMVGSLPTFGASSMTVMASAARVCWELSLASLERRGTICC